MKDKLEFFWYLVMVLANVGSLVSLGVCGMSVAEPNSNNYPLWVYLVWALVSLFVFCMTIDYCDWGLK